jgi:hypothetical protein
MLNLGKIDPGNFIAYLLVILSLVIPGAGYIYIAQNDLFFDLSISRLTILAIFYSLPIFIMSLMTSFMYSIQIDKITTNFKMILVTAGLYTLVNYYLVTMYYLITQSDTEYIYYYYIGPVILIIFSNISVAIIEKIIAKSKNKT